MEAGEWTYAFQPAGMIGKDRFRRAKIHGKENKRYINFGEM